MASIKWHFAKEPMLRWRGLNAGDIEHFKSSPVTSLAREIIQNSLDAGDDSGVPVSVNFDLISVRRDDFPDTEGLLSKIQMAARCERNKSDERTARTLELAGSVLGKSEIQILKISEQNTRGMSGPYSDPSSPFFAYTRGSGLSCKNQGIGSFGIGKKAPVANSELRTIFVSTVYPSEDGETFLCQGLTEWVSHADEDSGEFIDGLGFWGQGGTAAPIDNRESVPAWLRRDGVGTNIYVCAFKKDSSQWAALLAGSVLSSFFSSIRSGRLEVSVGTDYIINSSTIGGLFEGAQLETALGTLEDENHLERFLTARAFFKCLISDQSKTFQTQLQAPLGLFTLRVLVEEGLPKAVGFLRDGMFIAHNCLPSLKKFGNSLDFVAVVTCESESGNKILREMEPPEHNNFDGARIDQGSKYLVQIGKKIREQLLKVIAPDYTEIASVGFMSDLFGAESEEGEVTTKSPVEVDPNGRVKLTLKSSRARIPRFNSGDLEGYDENGDGVDGPRGDTEGSGGDLGAGAAPGVGGEKVATGGTGEVQLGSEVLVHDPRTLSKLDGSLETFLTIPRLGNYLLRFEISGSDSDEPLNVVSSSVGRPHKGGVLVTSEGGSERLQLRVRFDQMVKAAYVVKAYEI